MKKLDRKSKTPKKNSMNTAVLMEFFDRPR
jgi:hypothetical protein